MAQVTAEQLLAKVQSQAGRIAQLELINEALTAENAALLEAGDRLRAINEQAEVRDVAADITTAGKNGKA